MHNSSSSPAAAKAGRDQRTSLRVAMLLSLVLHALLAGGLATTSLGILPSHAPDNPTGTAIFKPRLAVDFPLEVAKAPRGAPAHEKPLELSLSSRRPAAAREPTRKPARNVSPQRPPEPDDARRTQAQTPQRSTMADAVRPEATRRLARSTLQAPTQQPNKAETLAMKGEASTAAPSPRPATTAPRPQRPDRSQRAAPSRQPQEVALLPEAKPRVPTSPRTAAARPEKATPIQGASLPRQATPQAERTAQDAKPEPLPLAAAPANAPSASPALRPAAMQPTHRAPASARKSPAATAAVKENVDTDTPAIPTDPQASALAVGSALRTQRADISTAATTRDDGAPSPLTRSQPAAGSGGGVARGEVAMPAAAAGAEGTGEAVAPRPAPGSRSRGEPGRASPGSVIAGAATAETDAADEFVADTPLSGSGNAAIAAGDRESRSSLGEDAFPHTSAAGGRSLGRADIGTSGAADRVMQADPLAHAAVGEPADDDGESAGDTAAGDTLAAAGPRPAARANRAAWRSAEETAISRDAAAGASMPAGDEASATELDGLSRDGLENAAAAFQLSALGETAGSGRRTAADGFTAPLTTVASLPRATAIVLPVENRVREVAPPFAKRAREKRSEQQTDAMVDRGLEFLRRAQRPDGRWQLGAYPGAADETAPKLASDTAATGLALLSFLGAGHDHFAGPHRDTVRRGLEFLLSVQKNDGDLFVPADPLSNSCGWLYSHGIATMALCEAVGMTGDEIIRPAAERACGFISASQHPDRGGWRYTPRSDADLSVTGWMLVALRSGQLARVPVAPHTLDGVRRLLDASALDPSRVGTNNPLARFHYNARKPDQRPSELSTACMTALGTLMRLHTGWKKTDQQVLDNGRSLATVRPVYGSSQQKIRDCYLWYYISQVLVHTGGRDWDSWYASLADTLSTQQATSGLFAGSWDPLGATPDRWGQYGGRIYVTTLHLLTLEVPYRHLPTYSLDE